MLIKRLVFSQDVVQERLRISELYVMPSKHSTNPEMAAGVQLEEQLRLRHNKWHNRGHNAHTSGKTPPVGGHLVG